MFSIEITDGRTERLSRREIDRDRYTNKQVG